MKKHYGFKLERGMRHSIQTPMYKNFDPGKAVGRPRLKLGKEVASQNCCFPNCSWVWNIINQRCRL